MPFRVLHLQSLSLRVTDGQLDWHPNRNESSNLAASLTQLRVHVSRIAYSMHSLQALVALQCLAIDLDLHTDSLEQLSSLVRLLSTQLYV